MSPLAVFVLFVHAFLIQSTMSQNCGCSQLPSSLSINSFNLNSGLGSLNAGYGGVGTGQVGVTGDIGANGNTVVVGSVPVLGSVDFGGIVSAAGIVSISGQCGCGCSK